MPSSVCVRTNVNLKKTKYARWIMPYPRRPPQGHISKESEDASKSIQEAESWHCVDQMKQVTDEVRVKDNVRGYFWVWNARA